MIKLGEMKYLTRKNCNKITHIRNKNDTYCKLKSNKVKIEKYIETEICVNQVCKNCLREFKLTTVSSYVFKVWDE